MTPSANDFLNVDAQLHDEERLLRSTVRAWVRERVLPNVAQWFEAGVFPREIASDLGRLGLLGMHLSGYGCAGASAVAYGIACMELEAGDSGVRSFASVQGSLAMTAIHRFGSDEQKAQWLPRMASGEVIGCFGLTEPDAGSNPAALRTVARRDGGDFVLNGAKTWITNGSIADVAIVWAQSDEGIIGFAIPTQTKGLRAQSIEHKLSMRASNTAEIVLDACRVPHEMMLPEAGGLRAPLTCLNEARYGIVWGAMGAARACYESAREYALSREQFDRPVAGFQLTQRKLVDMLLELEKGVLLALHLGRMKDARRLRPAQVSFGKLNNVREALAIARQARTILGANGISLEYPVIRHMNNLESVLTYEGTEEMHTLVLGEAITGLSAFT